MTTSNQFQDLDWVIRRCDKELASNKNRRVSALFRTLRKNPHYSLLGDYFLMWAIAKALHDRGLKRSRNVFSLALRQSEEYRRTSSKIAWLDAFTEISSGQVAGNKHGLLGAKGVKRYE